MRYAYPCNIEGNEDDGDGFVATFPDLQGASTGGFTFRETTLLAEDCLVVCLSSYIDRWKELPPPSPWARGQEIFAVQPLIAAQLDLYAAMRGQGVTIADLALRLNLPEAEAERLLSLDYRTSINEVVKALDAVGCRLAVEELAA